MKAIAKHLDDITKRMDSIEGLFIDFNNSWNVERNTLKRIIREIYKQNVKLREDKQI